MDETTSAVHWDAAYALGADSRSWYQPEATESLEFIASTGVGPAASIVDIGGGASPLVDGLLARGFTDITVLDLSSEGLTVACERLGAAGEHVAWVAEDVLAWAPGRSFQIWHDRAVLHFLTDDASRRAYAERATALVEPGGWLAVGGFAPGGPQSCSGLPVRGASGDDLAELFAPGFSAVRTAAVVHTTPGGTAQPFAWLVARRI